MELSGFRVESIGGYHVVLMDPCLYTCCGGDNNILSCLINTKLVLCVIRKILSFDTSNDSKSSYLYTRTTTEENNPLMV